MPAGTASLFPLSGDSIIFSRGNKLFELTNHLGNVLAVVSDKRYGVSLDDSTVLYYNPEVVSANDYYPFGMMQPGRNYTEANVGAYRFGFNGKENDNEVKGTGNQIDYGMRVYDPRIGKFLSLDPLTKQYPELTPYQYASNRPILDIDIDGFEGGLAPPPGAAATVALEDDGRVDDDDDLYRRSDKHDLGEALRTRTPEEKRDELKGVEEDLKDPLRGIRRFLAVANNYGRNGFNSAQLMFGGSGSGGSKDVTEAIDNFIGRGRGFALPRLNNSTALEQEIEVDAALARASSGTVTGTGKAIVGQWLKGTQGNAGYVPESVAKQLRGQNFKSFDDFRQAFWKAVGNTPELANQFKPGMQTLMRNGYAPFVEPEQATGTGRTQMVYQLHHVTPIQRGGAVYDVDNLMIVTPAYHQEVLSPTYHY